MTGETYPQSPVTSEVAPPQPVEPPIPEDDPNAPLRAGLILLLVFLVVVAAGAFLGSTLLNKSKKSDSTKQTYQSVLTQGKLVGVFLRNGTTYFGTLVFEDEKTLMLRDIYTPLGFFPSQDGGQPVFQVAKFNERNLDAPKEQLIQKEEILFSSDEVNPEVLAAIDNYVPPTPAPPPSPGPPETPKAESEKTETNLEPGPPSPSPGAVGEPESSSKFGI